MNESTPLYKRLDRTARDRIEYFLNQGKSSSQIAFELGYAISTITREIKTNRTDEGQRTRTLTGNITNLCVHYKDCQKTNICIVCQRQKNPRCASCSKVRCSTVCRDFILRECKNTQRSPYVCNACRDVFKCTLRKWRYRGADAQRRSDEQKVVTRSGIDTDPAIIEALNDIVRPLLRKGQSPGQIWLVHADEIPISRRTFYRYNDLGLFGMTALELPKKVRYKRRKKKAVQEGILKVPSGHSYKDFMALDEEARGSVTEMDTVMGTKDDVGSIFTLHLKRLVFQIGLKLALHDCDHVIAVLNWLESILGRHFCDVYGIGLCDRGIEFYKTSLIETSCLFSERRRMELYYCDARHSEQKGSAEKNHVELRKVIPKGTSIDKLTNYELATVFSHINSVPRRSLFGASPMQLAMEILPKKFFDELGLSLIAPDDIILNPSLLK